MEQLMDGSARELSESIVSGRVVAVVGLGYVGLPLAVEFGKRFQTVGYDISPDKIAAYTQGVDPSGEVSADELVVSRLLTFSADPRALAQADYVIVAVPTPVDMAHRPDFFPLEQASETVGRHMKQGCTVIYESTVYPGATTEICIPILERVSGLRWKQDFYVGYSPERINPGDREHSLRKVVKVVSGDSVATADRVAALYSTIVEAGVFRASSIEVAEAAKVIENIQRDLNIALMNELAVIFDRLQLDTTEVLAAAGTKWNFVRFKPGLVGGHCIGVDPYYLTHKAEMLGYHPEIILAGRRINDGMGKFIAEKTIKLMIQAGTGIKGATVNVLGLTFKENCPDLRNSKVPDIVSELQSYGVKVVVYDPLADEEEAQHEYGLVLADRVDLGAADAVVLAVAHSVFRELGAQGIQSFVRTGASVIDVKSMFDASDFSGYTYWRL